MVVSIKLNTIRTIFIFGEISRVMNSNKIVQDSMHRDKLCLKTQWVFLGKHKDLEESLEEAENSLHVISQLRVSIIK